MRLEWLLSVLPRFGSQNPFCKSRLPTTSVAGEQSSTVLKWVRASKWDPIGAGTGVEVGTAWTWASASVGTGVEVGTGL